MANAIGTAYVQILPSTQGIASGIAGALGGGAAAGAASAAGGALGAGMGASMGAALGAAMPIAAIGAAAAGMVSFGKASIETGMTFDASMSYVQALLSNTNNGLGATADEMTTLNNRAREMGASTRYTASEVAGAMGYMALAGWNVSEIYGGIPAVLDLAAASNMDLGRASDIVTDYMGAFSNTAPTAAGLVDTLAYAQANSNMTTEQAAMAWQYCAGSMNLAGQSAETTTAILARMADQGHKGSTAGTELNAAFTAMYKASENGAISINGQSIALTDSMGNWRNMIDIFGDIQQALGGDVDMGEWTAMLDQVSETIGDPELESAPESINALGEAMNNLGQSGSTGNFSQLMALAGVFGNVRALRGVAAILNGDTAAMKGFEDSLKNSGGTASKQAGIMQDNLAGDLKLLASATDELKIAVADTLMPILREVVQGLTAIVNWVNGGLSTGRKYEGKAQELEGQGADEWQAKGEHIQELIRGVRSGELQGDALKNALAEINEFRTTLLYLDLSGEGEKAVQGIGEGMTDYEFGSDAEQVCNGIIAACDDALMAHSPAQALVPTGQNAAQGIMQGMSQYDYTADAMLITQAIQTAITTNFTTADWSLASQATAAGIGAGIQAKLPLVESAAAQMVNATVNKVAGLVGAGGSTFKKFGYDIAAGIAAGIDEGSDLIADAISGAIRAGLDDAKDDAGVGSPSRLFADELGRWIPAGVAKGITDNSGVIGSALSDSMSDAAQWGGMAFPAGAAQGGFVQNVTVNSPTALSPWEVARQTRNATRRMALALRR